ncbi:MAG: tRNA 5-methoxyuridine(34)/uridine 5-oxyacetic acid(34) synthase CmoB [Gammaproteobacteria bacterium]
MIDYRPLYQELERLGAADWARLLSEQVEEAVSEEAHGDMARWQGAIDDLPVGKPTVTDLIDSVTIGAESDISTNLRAKLQDRLKNLHPWRKGPYSVYGLEIDTEWRSDWKWDRLKNQITPLNNRLVLDVGCGNGYHCWRMLGAGARMVVGIDPTLLSIMQFQAISKLYGDAHVYVMPIGIEQVPADLKLFDTVFSMGVLYHRRSPIDHLLELRGCLRVGGELVLETLVIDGGPDRVLLPEQRYAQMRNVWFLPSSSALMLWLRRCGFKNIKLCDVSKTSVDEQRSTEWMTFNSLKDFLNPDNDELTCEGLPAPTRAIITATA